MGASSRRLKIAVLGGESTGGRLVERILQRHPDVEVKHWSMPHGGGVVRHWPTYEDTALDEFDPHFVLVTVRDWQAMVQSKLDHHTTHLTAVQTDVEVASAYVYIMEWLVARPTPWAFLVYESLLMHGVAALNGALERTGIWFDSLGEDLIDGDAKYYAD